MRLSASSASMLRASSKVSGLLPVDNIERANAKHGASGAWTPWRLSLLLGRQRYVCSAAFAGLCMLLADR